MNRSVDHESAALNLIDRVRDSVQSGAVDTAVFDCLHLARLIRDYRAVALFLREAGAGKHEIARELLDALPEKAVRALWEIVGKEWLDGRTIRVIEDGRSEKRVHLEGIGHLVALRKDMEASIGQDFSVPPGMHPVDTAMFSDERLGYKLRLRNTLRPVLETLERARSRCASYASRVDAQLRAQQAKSDLVRNLQHEVDNYFSAHDATTHQRLVKASALASAPDSEDCSLLLTEVRRSLESAANHFYPPEESPVVCLDGKPRSLGPSEHLNRLHEFCKRIVKGSTARSLLEKELELLAEFMRRLNALASKGTHDQVTQQEARQGLLSVYLFLSHLISHAQSREG